MSLACLHCSAPLPEASIDRSREIATCPACGRVIDLRAHDVPRVEPAVAAPSRMRAPVALPPNMQLSVEPVRRADSRAGASSGAITITRRWLREKHYVLLLVLLAMSGGVAFAWTEYGASVPVGIATMFVISWTYMLLSMFLNRTVIRAGGGRVDVTNGPIPSLLYRNRSLAVSDLRQLYAARFGAVFAVKAQLADGSVQDLVVPLVTAEQALFVEQQLERALGLVDFEVSGELGADDVPQAPGSSPRAGRGGALLAILIPLFAIGVVAMFVAVSSSTLEGSLTAGGALGSWVITPDGCTSGQRAGFFGVELTSSADPAHRIRLSRDPVRGNLAIIEDPSQPRPAVIDIDACRRFDLTVTQTDTSINEVWVIEGSARLDCELLSGTVTFAGCH